MACTDAADEAGEPPVAAAATSTDVASAAKTAINMEDAEELFDDDDDLDEAELEALEAGIKAAKVDA